GRGVRRAGEAEGHLLAAQSPLGRLLFELGEVDDARAFESLGLEALFVEDGEAVSVSAVSGAARVVSWFGSCDATFARRLRALDPNAVLAGTAANGTPCGWEHLRADG